MRFTDSPFEKMMKQKPRPQAPAPAKPPRGSRCSGAPTGGASAVCPATGSSCGPRLAGGDGLARELTREEKRAIRALVTKWCANYDRECGCLPLDCECYMLGKCWTGAYCRYFREAVLPLDPALEVSLLSEAPGRILSPAPSVAGRPCGWAHGLLLRVLCPDCPAAAKAGLYAEKTEVMCGKLGPGKPRLYQGFPGPFWRWAVSFYGLPLFYSNAFHIYPAASGHFVQRWRGI